MTLPGITGGDVFEIVLLEPYPEDYDAIAERSQAELAAALVLFAGADTGRNFSLLFPCASRSE